MRCLARVLVLGSLAFLPMPSLAAPASSPRVEPVSLLTAMTQSYRARTFAGRFLYQRDHEVMTLEVLHAVIDGREHERLIRLDGPLVQIYRVNDDLLAVHGDASATRLTGRPGTPLSLLDRFSQLPSRYRVVADGEDRVAGRVTRRLRLQPEDAHRYGYRLWLDRESQLLLRSELVDGTGAVLERLEFVSLDLQPTLSSRDFVAPRMHRLNAIEDLGPVPSFRPHLQPGWLPEGFVLLHQDVRREAADRPPVVAMAYGDGLSAFTLFVQAMPDEVVVEDRLSRLGATVAVSRRLPLEGPDLYVTLVGELPIGTAQAIMAQLQVDESAAP